VCPDSLKRRVTVDFPKDPQPAMTTIEYMASPTHFIGSSWLWDFSSRQNRETVAIEDPFVPSVDFLE
jgi:hypothetical protein